MAQGQSIGAVKPPAAVPVALVDPRPRVVHLTDGRDIRFKSLPPGLSQVRAGQITQDELGFIWFGTQYGLDRFDGNRFRVFTSDRGDASSTSGSYIYTLFKDRAGSLWVASEGNTLDRLDPSTETFTRFGGDGKSAVPVAVVHISDDSSGALWLATGQGLFRLDPSNGKTVRYGHDPDEPRSLSSDDIKSTGEDRSGTFWVATAAGLDAFDRRTGRVTYRIPLKESREILFHEDGDGRLWIAHASGGGLAAFDRSTGRLVHYVLEPADSRRRGDLGIFSLLEDRDGTMWFGTFGAGLVKYDRALQRFISYRNDPRDVQSLASDRVTALYEDRDGNIWVGLHDKAPRVFSRRQAAFTTLPLPPGVDHGEQSLVSVLSEDGEGTVWMSTANTFYGIDRRSGRFTWYGSHGSSVGVDVLSVLEDSSGGLWTGTEGRGLRRLDRRTGRTVSYRHDPRDPTSLSSDMVEGLLVDRRGALWVATWNGLDRFEPSTQRFTAFKVDPRSNRSQLYLDAVEDGQGTIWLGSNNSGVHRFEPATGRFTVYQHSPSDSRSVSNNRVNSVFVSRAGALWVGTQHGLDEFHPETGTFTVYDTRSGLAGNVVNCVREDSHGNLWLSTNAGVSKFDPVRKTFANYSVADGLPGPDLTGWGACFKSSRGEMFFGGFSGATSFFPDSVGDDSDTATVVFTDLRISGSPVRIGVGSPLARSLPYTQALTLPYEKKAFSVEFSALSFLNPASIRYRYRLEGFDNDWNEVTNDDRHATYTTLPAGGYTLRVQAATQRGAWSSPGAVLRIVISPPWWRTWWFRGMLGLVIAALALAAYRRRIARIVERQRAVTASLRSRYEAALAERTRIAQELHDSLLQGFTGVSLELEGVRRMLPDRPVAAAQTLATVLETADTTLRDARAMIWDLRAPELDGHDLPVVLESAARRLIGGSPVVLRQTSGGMYRRLDPAVETTVLRVTREAVANALRHGSPSRIDIAILYESRAVHVVIGDDGRGLATGDEDRATSAGHWGIRGMRERVARHDGTLEIRSAPGSGCVVSLNLPVAASGQRATQHVPEALA